MRIDGMLDALRGTGVPGILMTLVGKNIAAKSIQIRTRAGKEDYYGKLPAGLNQLERAQQATRGGKESQAARQNDELKLRLDVPMIDLGCIPADSTGRAMVTFKSLTLVIVLMCSLTQLEAQTQKTTITLPGGIPANKPAVAGGMLASANHVPHRTAKGAMDPRSAFGSLQVTAVVRSSIQLTAEVASGKRLVASGRQEASVAIPVVSGNAASEAGESEEQFRLNTLGSLANLPGSHGYQLEATWRDGGTCTLKFDGLILPTNSPSIVSVGLGVPYDSKTEHTLLITHHSESSSPVCSGTLVLTARPSS